MTWEQGFGMRNQMRQGVLRLNQRRKAFVPPKCWSVLACCGFREGESLLLSEINSSSSNEQCCVHDTMAAWTPPALTEFACSSGLSRLNLSLRF